MANEFTAIIEATDDGWYWAHCPEMPAANGQGHTPEEAKEDLAEAIRLVLDVLREEALQGYAANREARTVDDRVKRSARVRHPREQGCELAREGQPALDLAKPREWRATDRPAAQRD